MEDKQKDWLFRVFLTLSLIWAVVVFWLLFDDQQFYSGSSAMKLNEVGDFLAGSFSPLAFFWLAYGYWMQNKELKVQLSEYSKSLEVSNDTLDLYKKQDKEREIMTFNLAQPLLFIGKISHVKSNFSNEIKFNLINKGALVLDLAFYKPDNEGNFLEENKIFKTKIVEMLKIRNIELPYPWKPLPQPDIRNPEEYIVGILFISYIDANREKQIIKAYFYRYIDKGANWSFRADVEKLHKSIVEN